MLRTFILNGDGSLSLSNEGSVAQPRLAKIVGLLQRDYYDAMEVSRLISAEIDAANKRLADCKYSSELRKAKQFLGGLILTRDYVDRINGTFDPAEHRFDTAELKFVEEEVLSFLRSVAFSDERSWYDDAEPAFEKKTFGEVFPKSIIELIRDDTPGGSVQFLLWNGTQQFLQDRLQLKLTQGGGSGTMLLIPPDVDPSVLRAIRLPSSADRLNSTQELFNDINALIGEFTQLSSELSSLVTCSVLASWFPDCTPVPVCLSIVGPRSCQRFNLFRLLGCLFRRPVILGEISANSIWSLPMELYPSLFLERSELNHQLPRIFSAPIAQGTYVPWKGRFRSMACAKVICSEERFDQAELGQGSIRIPVSARHWKLPILNNQLQEEIAEKFQSRLLGFRLEKYKQVRDSNFDLPCHMSSARDLARSLGACVSDVPELRSGIQGLLRELDYELQAESECTTYLRNAIVQALKDACSEKGKSSIHVAEITTRANGILEKSGELQALNSKRTGMLLKGMGVYTTRLGASGRGILLLTPTRQRIRCLSTEYDSDLTDGLEDECDSGALGQDTPDLPDDAY